MDTRTVQMGTMIGGLLVLILTVLGMRYTITGALIMGGLGLILVLHGYLSYIYFLQR